MSDKSYCGNCGSQIKADVRFCPECGYPIKADAWPPSPAMQAAIPPTEKMENPQPSAFPGYDPGLGYSSELAPKKSNLNLILIAAGLVVAACCVLGGAYAVGKAVFGGDSDSPLSVLENPTETPTKRPPTSTPIPPIISTPTQPAVTGRQELSDTSFFDDFSSKSLGWNEEMDASSGTGYEDGRYFIQVNVPDYRQMVFTPLDAQTHMEFSAEVTSGASNGAFGMACYWQDFDNHHYIYFDLESNNFFIGKVENKEWTDLTERLDFPKVLGPQRYAVDCTPGMISVYINDALVHELPVNMPVQELNHAVRRDGLERCAAGRDQGAFRRRVRL